MGTGYSRNDTSNNIADGNIINAADLDGEFDAIQSAFNASTGHTHDGTTAEGAPITVTGPVQDYVSSATEFRPKTNNTYDLGSLSLQWKDLYVDGTGYIDSVDIDGGAIDGTTIGGSSAAAGSFTTLGASGNATVGGTLGVTGLSTLASVDINGGNIDGTTIGSASAAAGTFTTATATTGNITTVNATTVDSTNVEVTNIKAKDGTASATIADSTGVMTIASSVLTTTDINGGTIDGVTIGGSSAGAITGTTITGSSFVTTGDMTFGDNDKAIFGAGSDLQIYHDGSNSFIEDTGTGDLNIRANDNLRLQSATTNENFLKADSDGAVTLYHNNIERIATTSTGVDVTGTVTADGLTVDGGAELRSTSNPTLEITNTDTSIVDAQLYGSLNFVSEDGSLESGRKTVAGVQAVNRGGSGSYAALDFYRSLGTSAALTVKGMTIDYNGDISFYEDTGTTPKFFWDASAEALGIGTSSPSVVGSRATVDVSSSAGGAIRLSDDTSNTFIDYTDGAGARISVNAAEPLTLRTNSTNRVTIDGSGNVGIGTSSPSAPMQVASTSGSIPALGAPSSHVAIGSGGFGTMIGTKSTGDGYIQQQRFDGTATAYDLLLQPNGGNVGIGTSSPSANLHISGANGYIKTERTGGSPSAMVFGSESGANAFYSQDGSGGASPLRFAIGTTERMRIDSSGNVGIGVVPSAWRSTTDAIQFGQSASISSNNNANAISFTSNAYVNSSNNSVRISTGKVTNYYQFDGAHVWDYAGSGAAGTTVTYSEAMRIDASGNLLVGRTSSSGVDTDGHVLWGSGISYQSATSNSAQFINRNGTDGAITTFYKSGSPVGSIGTASSVPYFYGASGFRLGAAIQPVTSAGALSDNTTDIGQSNARFKDIYAANALIQTSDANEKQDIAELDEAERRVAVAAKGLLRKFRWKDAVAEKGDDARIHFGIIAQDLQAAFEAEGLDAGRYAMFIHSTWTDEETGEERSRMGVRYSELLAFIIAAI